MAVVYHDATHLASKARTLAKEIEKVAERFEAEVATVRCGDVVIDAPCQGRATITIDGVELAQVTKVVLTLEVDRMPTLHIERLAI